MSTYYHGSGLTYLQYLQAKTFVSDIKGAQQKAVKAVNLSVARQTRELIASQEALARENIRTMEAGFGRVAQVTQEGFEHLSWEIQDVGRGISEVNATFQWGFGEMLNQMTRLNSAVSELVKLAKTPVQTEANEYFQNARDALRRGLYPEALEESEKAIAKHKLEWRYYSLAGTVRLGSISGDLALLDLSKAEEYFLLAARYAKADDPEDAARSYLAASWAAYCQGKMGPALSHAENAVNLHPKLAEALFQAGKVYMALGEPDNALPLLGKAIDLDKCYALKAAADGDFQRHEPDLRAFLEALRQEKLRHIRPAIEAAMKEYEFWLARSATARHDPLIERAKLVLQSGLPLWDLLAAQEELATLQRVLAERSAQFRFFDRVEEPGPVHEIEEKYIEAVPEGAGLLRRLGGAKERTRRVRKSWRQEHILIHVAAGAILAKIDFSLIPPGRVNLWHQLSAAQLIHLRRLKITRAFVLSTTLVTASQYEAILPKSQPRSADSSLPAVNVSWIDAVSYCNALSRELGLNEAYVISPSGVTFNGLEVDGYRLPTEAEWDRALRGESTDLVGITLPSEVDASAWSVENGGRTLHPVALKRPNAQGLYDMLGNVAEWVFDWYSEDEWECPDTDPTGPNERYEVRPKFSSPVAKDAKCKTTRGGSYLDTSEYIKSGGRARGLDPKTKSPTVGFRIARTVAQ